MVWYPISPWTIIHATVVIVAEAYSLPQLPSGNRGTTSKGIPKQCTYIVLGVRSHASVLKAINFDTRGNRAGCHLYY